MAERLTEKDKYGNNAIFQKKDKFTIAKDKNNDIRVYGKAIDKLAQLEDIMEKYHCNDIEELEKILGWLYTLSGKDIELMKFIAQERKQIHDMYCEIKKDRDTWKRACELACDVILRFTDGCPCKADYFYQQAKKEGENETA